MIASDLMCKVCDEKEPAVQRSGGAVFQTEKLAGAEILQEGQRGGGK